MNTSRSQHIDSIIARPGYRPAGRRPAAVAKPAATIVPRVRHGGSIDGIMSGPRPPAPTPARPSAPPAYKAHLQPHPMLRRPPAVATPPARPRPARELVAAPELTLQPRPLAPSRRSAVKRRLAWHGSRKELVGLVVGSLLALLSVFSLQLGEIVIGLYAVLVVWKHISSRFSFMLALGMFVGIIISQLITPASGIADNLAVYAFLLLCVGTLALAREVHQDTSVTDS